jgi:hypothetical protein
MSVRGIQCQSCGCRFFDDSQEFCKSCVGEMSQVEEIFFCHTKREILDKWKQKHDEARAWRLASGTLLIISILIGIFK